MDQGEAQSKHQSSDSCADEEWNLPVEIDRGSVVIFTHRKTPYTLYKYPHLSILYDMQINDLENAPKLFCENIKIGYSNEYFVIALSSGAQAAFYSLTPEHAKRLMKYLSHEIEGYEKKHGDIHADWSPNVVSPVQKLNPPIEGS